MFYILLRYLFLLVLLKVAFNLIKIDALLVILILLIYREVENDK